MYRIGQGYDVHRLVEGRELWLCGEKIDFELGLLGHSDADVAIHALCDAILGALALGDIGKHFPDSDPRYKGIDSKKLLYHVCHLMREKGYELGNCDLTICAERPKLRPHIDTMRQTLAEVINTSVDNISVKATTTERLGFTGRMEGISAYAVALLRKS
ncbi:MAG: 2-C-methyl-D-erythritol 2,4-cyclodiphosphate synthase [Bacteroides sp.]|nr:2-C-methyl-D-erythritol 2,4-cyclodiphosphate synthase [Bacteroides sp.]